LKSEYRNCEKDPHNRNPMAFGGLKYQVIANFAPKRISDHA